MQTHVSFRHTDGSQRLRTLAETEIEKLSRFYGRIERAQVTLAEDGLTKCAEVRLGVPGPDLVCSEKGASLEEALDRCIGSLRHALIKRKEQQHSHDASRDVWH